MFFVGSKKDRDAKKQRKSERGFMAPLYRYHGDREACEKLKHQADILLKTLLHDSVGIHKQESAFSQMYCLPTGSKITARKTLEGRPIIDIWGVSSKKKTTEEVEQPVEAAQNQLVYVHGIFYIGGEFEYEARAGMWDCLTNLEAVIPNPCFGLKDINGNLLNAEATENFTFPARVLIQHGIRSTIDPARYLYMNPRPAKTFSIRPEGDIRTKGQIYSVSIVNGGSGIADGKIITIPAVDASGSGDDPVKTGSGGKIRVTTKNGVATEATIIANGIDYVDKENITCDGGIKINISVVPDDASLCFHCWYVSNCRDGNVKLSNFESGGLSVDHNGNAIYSRQNGTNTVTVVPNDLSTQCNQRLAPTGADSFNSTASNSESTETVENVGETNNADQSQFSESNAIGLAGNDFSDNEKLIISAYKKQSQRRKTGEIHTCSYVYTNPYEITLAVCGGGCNDDPTWGPYWGTPGHEETDAATNILIDDTRNAMSASVNGLSVYQTEHNNKTSVDYNNSDVNNFNIYSPLGLLAQAGWPIYKADSNAFSFQSGYRKTTGAGSFNVVMGINGSNSSFASWLIIWSGEAVYYNASDNESTSQWYNQRKYWLINSDTLCYVLNYPTLIPILKQDRWRLAYNNRATDTTDHPGDSDTIYPEVPLYFMQLYVTIYNETDSSGYKVNTSKAYDLNVAASLQEENPAIVFFYDGDTRRLRYAANSASSNSGFEAYIKKILEAEALNKLTSANASFVSYKKSRELLVDRSVLM